MSVQLAAQDFTTPDKGGPTSKMSAPSAIEASPFSTTTNNGSSDMKNSYSINSVTPTDSSLTNKTAAASAAPGSTSGKHVRFGAEGEKTSDPKLTTESPSISSTANNNNSSSSGSSTKRGLVSRRGGRYVSPGRPLAAANATGSSTFRTPTSSKTSSDEHPGLCSAGSVGLVSLPSQDTTNNKDSDVKDKIKAFDGANHNRDGGESGGTSDVRRPTSISCDPSSHDPTSPLAKATPQKTNPSFDDDSKDFGVRSPVPSTATERFKKTPTRSPTNSQFHTLPSLDDTKLGSPTGFMLSPHPSTPHKNSRDPREDESNADPSEEDKIRDYSKEKFPLTPTNFSLDYGKSPKPGIFDNSNVLNWLQSPTGNGLFSPGGLNSLMNTPKGPIVPRTPGTPTVSTSFFFSDAASLPQNGENARDAEAAAKSPKKGLSNIICISPLASSRNRGGNPHAAQTPINYNDIFASPNPLLEDSPMKVGKGKGQGSSGDPSLDAVHLARSDLLQDEDLSVLLQLAGGNTPKGAGKSAAGGHVFRGSRKGDEDRENHGLQLPIIGDQKGDSAAARLSRKSHSRDFGGENDSFVGSPSLAMRKAGSSSMSEPFPDKTSIASSNTQKEHPGQPSDNDKSKNGSNSTMNSKPVSGVVRPFSSVHTNPYAPRPQDMFGYPPSVPPHGRPTGRMSVVVGGPPPSSRPSKSTSAAANRHPPSSHRRPNYPQGDSYPPPGMSYPPPHGHYPPHPMHMGAHPYHNHYSAPPRHHPHPPSHMPMYGAQHPAPSSRSPSPTKKAKASPKTCVGKPPAKRPSIGSDAGKPPAKKAKKSPGPKRAKGRSPQLTDREGRQKAAQTIAAVNVASGGKNDKAAALAAAILRGVTMRPSGKWQAQLYFAGKSRYIGVFDTREKAALAYEIAREKLKAEKQAVDGALSPKQTENAVNAARKAAFDGVNEKDPRLEGN